MMKAALNAVRNHLLRITNEQIELRSLVESMKLKSRESSVTRPLPGDDSLEIEIASEQEVWVRGEAGEVCFERNCRGEWQVNTDWGEEWNVPGLQLRVTEYLNQNPKLLPLAELPWEWHYLAGRVENMDGCIAEAKEAVENIETLIQRTGI